MPHANGRIYIDTSTTPPTGINIQSDIAYVLGVASRDVGTLCTSEEINMWSLSKPVALASHDHPSNWQAAWNGNYGIAPYKLEGANPLNTLRQFSFDGLLNGWEYEKPRGSVHNEWFRPLDFDGYNHFSPRPWNGWTGSAASTVGGGVYFGLDNVVNDWNGGPGSIFYKNIKLVIDDNTSMMLDYGYFGVVIFNSNNVITAIATCPNRMGAAEPEYFEDANWSCEFLNVSWATGRYKAYPFFWVGTYPPTGTTLNDGVIFTVPFTMPIEFTISPAPTPSTGVSLRGAFGIDEETATTVTIGIGPAIFVDTDYTYTVDRIQVYIKGSGSGGFDLIYDTANDADYTPAIIYGRGSTWDIVDTSATGGNQGITNCPASVVKPKLPLSGYYTGKVVAILTPTSGSRITLEKDDYSIS